MKKSIISLAAIILSTVHCCLASPLVIPASPVTITLDQTFTGLVVDDNISIVLTNDTGNEITLAGDPGQEKKVKAAVKKGTLHVWLTGGDKTGRITVWVPAKLLRTIIVNGESTISTASLLENAGMKVLVNGACKLALRSRGSIEVNGTEDYEFKSGLHRI